MQVSDVFGREKQKTSKVCKYLTEWCGLHEGKCYGSNARRLAVRILGGIALAVDFYLQTHTKRSRLTLGY